MSVLQRSHHRHRRPVSKHTLKQYQWLFRYSSSRDAYVLRGVGRWVGPVLREGQSAHHGHVLGRSGAGEDAKQAPTHASPPLGPSPLTDRGDESSSTN